MRWMVIGSPQNCTGVNVCTHNTVITCERSEVRVNFIVILNQEILKNEQSKNSNVSFYGLFRIDSV